MDECKPLEGGPSAWAVFDQERLAGEGVVAGAYTCPLLSST